tara:strand:+ start:41 stop:1552 length:1512 start_codon:yes stop_codon:yes gene_type:complete
MALPVSKWTTDKLQEIGNDLLNRDFGSEGLEYWKNDFERTFQAAIDSGKTRTQAAAEAEWDVRRNIARSSEAKAEAGVPEWFQHQDEDYKLGQRPEDWAGDLKTSNLENYLDDQNYQYGMLQGNTVGQEGNEWWGWQTTQDIQSHLAQGKSYAEAYDLATAGVDQAIRANTGHQNYLKYGTIGYGNPLEIVTSTDDTGDILTEKRYLNLSERAIADSAAAGASILNPTGSKTATKYNFDDEGEINMADPVLDDDGNPVTAQPLTWQYVADSNAPGGYRIEAVPFDTGTKTTTAAHEFITGRYQRDGAFPGGGGSNPFTIPPGTITNVDAARFTSTGDDKLNLAQWAETPQGKLSIAANDYQIKNKWMADTTGDGMLNWRPDGIDHANSDSNLQLGQGNVADLPLGEGWVLPFKGPDGELIDPPEEETTANSMAGTGGPTIVIDMNQKSKTAKDQAVKADEKGQAAGKNRATYNTIKKGKGQAIQQLGIPAVNRNKQSLMITPS